MMRTADQVRLQLERCMEAGECPHCMQLIAVLHAVLPDLIALAQGRSDDAGARYRDMRERDEAALRAAQERANAAGMRK